jgi:hypothetical protein
MKVYVILVRIKQEVSFPGETMVANRDERPD